MLFVVKKVFWTGSKYKKKDLAESTAKRDAPIEHMGHCRANPEVIDKTPNVYLNRCPICGGEKILPCNHTTEHIQEDFEDGKLTSTRFIYCLKLSNAALVGFDKHMTKKGKPLYDTLKQSLPDYQFMHADETGWKRAWRLWVFTNPFISF